MNLSKNKEICSDSTLMEQETTQSPALARPFKIQKLQTGFPMPGEGFTDFQHADEIGSTSNTNHQHQAEVLPAHNQDHQENPSERENQSEDPFFYYQENHVEESIKKCTNSLIGKILSDKPISAQILHSTLSGIWCKPEGFKITELEGKKFQILMNNEVDIQRILKSSPWIIRNCWLLLRQWDRKVEIQALDFTHVPIWIQFWGLPLHCKSIIMGKEMGSQLGSVLDVGLYEFPENAKTVKVKILFDISHPIRAGMYIGNQQDGISWIDFRYENMPMFCFGCGLIGHNIENCKNPHLPYEGGTNPRGAWLRSKTYGRRIHERPEKTFCSNPLRSMSGGSFSPIHNDLMEKMADMSIHQQGSPLGG